MFTANTSFTVQIHRNTRFALLIVASLSLVSTTLLGQSMSSAVDTTQGNSVIHRSAVDATAMVKNPFLRNAPLVLAQAAQPGSSAGSPSNSAAGSALPTDENGGTASGKSSVRTLVDDSIVTTKIKAAMLADPGVKATEVSVETNSGEVTLSGAVGNQPAMEQAEKIAKKVTGVRSVVNNLTLKK
jgi:hyperosmotically inducible protein